MADQRLTDPTENFTDFAALPHRLIIPEGKVTSSLNEAHRNFQLALTRLITDVTERRACEMDGIRFQKKYNLTNDQMFSLARIASDCGEIRLNDNWQATIKKMIKTAGEGVDVGTCSCCCP